MRECFELHARPGAGGTLRLGLVLDRDGHVTAAHVESDHLHAHGAGRCIRRYARSWRLPPPPADGTRLSYTFLLR